MCANFKGGNQFERGHRNKGIPSVKAPSGLASVPVTFAGSSLRSRRRRLSSAFGADDVEWRS